MKSRFVMFIAVIWMAGVLCVASASARAAQTWALLIGVSEYESPQITSLKFPAIDAQGIRDALIDEQYGALPAANVRLLVNSEATREGIWNAVDEFLVPNVKEGDQVILFMAGHGIAKGVGVEAKSYLLPTDAKGLTTAALNISAVDLKTLSDRLAELPASQFVVFVDACREDPTPGRGIKGNLLSDVMSRGAHIVPKDEKRPATSVTFFACGVGQRAFEDESLNHGVFTYWILDAIQKAAVPQKPDGAIPMGRLASYVSDKVEQWSEQISSQGGFEIEQKPETIASGLAQEPIVLMRVKRPLPDQTYKTAPPQLVVATYPEGAQVSVNGRSAGSGSVRVPLEKGGEYEVQVTASGYQPTTSKVRVLDGLQFEVPIRLQPGARGASPNQEADEMYQRAVNAEETQQYEIAQAGYEAVIGADATYQPAYERLARLRARRDDGEGSLSTLIQMVANVPSSARTYSLLARAYGDFSARQQQELGADVKLPQTLPALSGDYRVPLIWTESAAFARRAADEAVKLDSKSSDSQLALGFALTVAPDKAKNAKAALAAFGRAVFAAPRDADAQYSLAYGIRNFAVLNKDEKKRKAELERAVNTLKQALALRPDFYEANLELAYCYHLLDQAPAAVRQYQVAGAHRGEATDKNDVAGIDVALSSLYRQQAEKERGQSKTDYLLAADAYLNDAKETSPDLRVALSILNSAGLNTSIRSFLPGEMQEALGVMSDPAAAVESKIREKIKLPGGIRLPF